VGVLSWAREVIADRGAEDPIPIHIERTPDGHGYALRLGIGAGFGGQETARVPVRRRLNSDPHPVLKEVHECEVAGRTLQAANVYALRKKVSGLLDSIAPARRLPVCWFRSPRMDYELPVYELGGELSCPVLGGPRLRAPDLSRIRREVCRYLVSAGYVGDAEEVEVGVLRPRDLRRVPPACVFRSQADPSIWLPSVEGRSPDGAVVGLLGASPRLVRRRGHRREAGSWAGRREAGPPSREPAPSAPDVVALLRSVRAELARSDRGDDADPDAAALQAAQVRPEIWAAAEERTEDSGLRLVAYLTDHETTTLELGVRATGAGDVCAALEDRGINVFLAPDADALAQRVGTFLAGSGFVRFAAEVEIHDARVRRADQLDADAIGTFDIEEVTHAWR
jgi:hypothetical protein